MHRNIEELFTEEEYLKMRKEAILNLKALYPFIDIEKEIKEYWGNGYPIFYIQNGGNIK